MIHYKQIIKEIGVLILIIGCVDAFWIFADYWWHYFFVIGFFLIGWYIPAYYHAKRRLAEVKK